VLCGVFIVLYAWDIRCHSFPLLTRPLHHVVKCLIFTLSHLLFYQGKLETAESEVVQLMDILYAKIDDQRLPEDLKAALETKVQYTNDSLQVFFTVSRWRFEGDVIVFTNCW
jgi:hypothetical protein